MSAVSVQQVMAWLDYWALPASESYTEWDSVFNNIPDPPHQDPATYLEAATWIAANYTGGPVPPPH